jgi:hypothetical protein
MKKCLNCSTMNSDDAERCLDCHVPFDRSAHVESESGWLTPAGWTLVVLGVLMVIYGLFASGAPQYSETLNIGLLNDKTNMVIAGGFAFTSGSTFLGIGAVLTRLAILNAASRPGVGQERT